MLAPSWRWGRLSPAYDVDSVGLDVIGVLHHYLDGQTLQRAKQHTVDKYFDLIGKPATTQSFGIRLVDVHHTTIAGRCTRSCHVLNV